MHAFYFAYANCRRNNMSITRLQPSSERTSQLMKLFLFFEAQLMKFFSLSKEIFWKKHWRDESNELPRRFRVESCQNINSILNYIHNYTHFNLNRVRFHMVNHIWKNHLKIEEDEAISWDGLRWQRWKDMTRKSFLCLEAWKAC